MVHDDTLPPAPETDNPPDSPTEGQPPLQTATAAWIRRGYRVRYRDTYLIQLIRRRRLGLRSSPYMILALAALGLALAAWIAALRRRPWHVVTVVRGPNGRILTHHHTAPQPPEP